MSTQEFDQSTPASGASAEAVPPAPKPRPDWTHWALLAGLLGVLAFMQWRGSFAPTPPVFDEGLTLNQGITRAEKGGRLVLAYASASWCGPCQTYKRTTLIDKDVVAWIRRHAEPVYVNIDRQPTDAQQLGVASIPATILLKDGKEVARLTGAASAEEFLQWVKPWTPLVQK